MKQEEENTVKRHHRLLVLFALGMLAALISLSCAAPERDGEARSSLVTNEPSQTKSESNPDQQERTDVTARDSGSVSLVGALQGDPSEYNRELFGDVAGYKNLAFVGKWHEGCPGTGVDIIDISQPSAPEKLSDTTDYPDTSMEDMQAMEIGGRDILAVGLQDCGTDQAPGVGKAGLELYDITDPHNPLYLAFFDIKARGADSGGVHELDLTTTPGGDILALGAAPYLESLTVDTGGEGGMGDLLIWSINDPTNPTLIGEWGILDEPTLGDQLPSNTDRGGDPRSLGHSTRANAHGTRVYLSYWDAGVIMLDISDPAAPVYLGRTSFEEGEEGNAHSVDEAHDSSILVQADEDLVPFHFELSSSALPDGPLVAGAAFEPSISASSGREMAGEIAHVGRGCPAGSIGDSARADAYLADPSGRIALIESGGCRFDEKIAQAQRAGASGVVLYTGADGYEDPITTGEDDSVSLPDGTVVDVDIPAIFVERSTGLLLRNVTPPVTASASAMFDGWGYLRFFDIADPAVPVRLGTFVTENTNDEEVAIEGWWSAHNPEVRGDTVYASWYRDGLRVIDISDPSSPRETGSWTGADAPPDAPPVDLWSVVPHGDLLLASDRNYGLYVLRHTP